MKIFFPVSGLLFGSGFGYYLYTFITLHRFTNMSALLSTAAVMVFMMGLISEQNNGAELSRRGSLRRVPVGLL